MSDNIFREVDEELRNERMRALWSRYGIYVIGGAVAIVLVVAANEAWKWWQASEAARSSDLFEAVVVAIEDGDADAARAAIETTVGEASGEYPVLARFAEAGMLASGGDTEAAIAAYDELAGTVENTRLRELAQLYTAYLLADSGDVAAVSARVATMLAPDHPMRNAAREALALTNYVAGEGEAALSLYNAILDDPETTQDIGSRAAIAAAQLASEGVALPVAAAAGAETETAGE